MFPLVKKVCVYFVAGIFLSMLTASLCLAQDKVQATAIDVAQLVSHDLSQVDAGERHPLSQDAAATLLRRRAEVWSSLPAALEPGKVILLKVPKAWLGQDVNLPDGFEYSLLWQRQGIVQASWIRTQGQALAVPSAVPGRIFLLVENSGEQALALKITHQTHSYALTKLKQFSISPLGPLAASISWVAVEQPDVRAWILEKRSEGGSWEPVLNAPLPVRSQGDASYGMVDLNRPGAGGEYRLVAVDASGFLVIFRTIQLSE